MMRAFLGLVLLALLLASCGAASPARAAEPEDAAVLSLEQVVQTALKRNPGLAASQEDVAVSEAQLTQTSSAYWPQLSAQSGYSRQWYENARSALSQGGVQGQYNNYQGGLTVSQYLYDFGQTSGRVEKGRQTLESSRQGLAKTRFDLVRDVKNAYYEVLKQEELVGVYQESLRVQKEHLRQAQAFYKAGVKARLDVTNSELAVANTDLQLLQAQLSLDTARVSLESILGGPPAPGPYRLARLPEARVELAAPEQLVRDALKLRPEVASLQAQLRAAQAQLQTAQGGYWPSLNANASWGYQNTDWPLQEGWLAGASLSWPLFNGLRTQGAVSEAKAGIRKIEAQIAQIELGVRQDVTVAVLRVRQTGQTTETARLALRQARENMALADSRWKVGAGSYIEYSDAQNLLTQAKGNLVQATYLRWQALADLERALGRPQHG